MKLLSNNYVRALRRCERVSIITRKFMRRRISMTNEREIAPDCEERNVPS